MPSPQASKKPVVKEAGGELSAPEFKESDEVKGSTPEVKKPSGIEVVAIRKGFFKNSRKKEGDKFLIPNEDALGEWMKCTDPKADLAHQKRIKEKKKKRQMVRI